MNDFGLSKSRIIRLSELPSYSQGGDAVWRIRNEGGRGSERVEGRPSVGRKPGRLHLGHGVDAGAADGGVDVLRIERAVREILLAIGEDPDRDGLRETPRRVARVCREFFAGSRQDRATCPSPAYEPGADSLVAVRNIALVSVCEHHLLPFFGRAHIAYRPLGSRVAGFSRLARMVEVLARRPQVQERLTVQIADAVAEHLGAAGVAVVCEAQHLCTAMCRVGQAGSSTTTAAFRGELKDDPRERAQALRLLGVESSGTSGCIHKRIGVSPVDWKVTRSPGGMR